VQYLALVMPIAYPANEAMAARTTADLTRDYIRTSQYLTGLANAVGDLILSGNKLVNIAGYTARVAELLEMIQKLGEFGTQPFVIREDERSELASNERDGDGDDDGGEQGDEAGGGERAAVEVAARSAQLQALLRTWKQQCDARPAVGIDAGEAHRLNAAPDAGLVTLGDNIRLAHVDLVSPDGKLLVRDLTFQVERGVNVMVTGKYRRPAIDARRSSTLHI
jgi:hypothetical protein